jgi:hypothetical protein
MLTFTVVAFRSGVTGTTVSANPGSVQQGPGDRARVVSAGTPPSHAEHLSLARQNASGVTQTGTNRLLMPAGSCVDVPLGAPAITVRAPLKTAAKVGGSAMAARSGTRARNHRHLAARDTVLAPKGRQQLPAATH